MIESISISDVATYDLTGIKVEQLKKVNFIYGANGTGKTTISNLLNENERDGFQKSDVKWQHDMPLQTLVYNKEFREQNFGQGKIPGVFTLGEATKQEEAAIERMTADLARVKEQGVAKKESLSKLSEEKNECDDSFRENAWKNLYKKYEQVFKGAFAGAKSKKSFLERLLKESKNNCAEPESFEDLEGRAETIFGETPTEVPLLNWIEYSRLIEIESDTIWPKVIIGKGDIDIAPLIQQLNLNDWVNQGRVYINDTNTCPFCQKETITSDFRAQLDAYFDEAFKNDTARVMTLSEEYNRLAQNLSNTLQLLESSEKANPKRKINLSSLEAGIKTTFALFSSNRELLSNKCREPSKSVDLASLMEQLGMISALISEANAQIKAHNQIVRDFSKEKERLVKDIWKYLASEYGEQVGSFVRLSSGKEAGMASLARERKNLLGQYTELNNKIKEATKNVTSVQPSVDEINRLLTSYGFLNFKIVPAPNEVNHYLIQRDDGTIAESTLSEGEITFITFLYYLQLAKGGLTESAVYDARVLVIDDPVSSLDSNVLFIISSLVKEIICNVKKDIGNIKQIILLTHNVYFHKEVSFIDGRTKVNGETHFWILRKANKTTSIQAYERNNPIASSYDLLWRELKEWKENSGITVQNTMRRIIENYFKILGKYRDDDLINKFPSAEERGICRSLLCWINDGSHCLPDDLFIEAPDDSVQRYHDVFKAIFEHTDHLGHYNMMMGIERE